VISVANARQDFPARKNKYSKPFFNYYLKVFYILKYSEKKRKKLPELPVFFQSGLMAFSCPSEANLPKFLRRFRCPSLIMPPKFQLLGNIKEGDVSGDF
jgi:hypothetical protein